jgi:phosphoribosylformylglycinamidine cyclo-ligase
VDRKNIVVGSTVQEGDVIIGLRSSGLHTNGYSLARKVCFEVAGLACNDPMPGAGRSVGEELLEPHRSYAKVIQLLMRIVEVKGMAHITGGGITDNLPRSLPAALGAEVDLGAWKIPPVFTFIQRAGRVADLEMLRTFNMGMGYLAVFSEDESEKALDALRQAGEEPACIGRVVAGENAVRYVGKLRYDE